MTSIDMSAEEPEKNSKPNSELNSEPTPFTLTSSHGNGSPSKWLITSPHSGHYYPRDFILKSKLDSQQLRLSEDMHIDALLADAPQAGAGLLSATYPRAYVDLNREPYELDASMFSDPLPDYVNKDSTRVLGGLGTIAKIVTERLEIYDRPLVFSEAEQRIEKIYFPFHTCLKQQIETARDFWGKAYLLDVHSMPSNAVRKYKGGKSGSVDFVLGNRHGRSCDADIYDVVYDFLTDAGYYVEKNKPYAGGYITEHYGNPSEGFHTLQLEVNRKLYMNETSYDLLGNSDEIRNLFSDLVSRLINKTH
ncbi:MAG: N-formylglutamate amidohydrolase [Candidatus Micropelagos sp.]|uniref:N-formylglutamate amidohydrolase n=1 Tax=PS1 clade bacterium TaxID=2175152 RepID=A0A368EL83_9PROT|nr:MAG: N-formylglutamate amidohydrolase [PS1 clade bacterium]